MTNNMKKINLSFMIVALLVGVALTSSAQWNMDLPTLQRVRSTYITDGAEQIVVSGRALLLGLVRSTGPEVANVLIRNTSVASDAGKLALPRIHWFVGTGVTDNPIPYPVLFDKGISVDINDATAGAQQLTVIYLPLY